MEKVNMSLIDDVGLSVEIAKRANLDSSFVKTYLKFIRGKRFLRAVAAHKEIFDEQKKAITTLETLIPQEQ